MSPWWATQLRPAAGFTRVVLITVPTSRTPFLRKARVEVIARLLTSIISRTAFSQTIIHAISESRRMFDEEYEAYCRAVRRCGPVKSLNPQRFVSVLLNPLHRGIPIRI